MTASQLGEYLSVLQAANVMSCRLVLNGELELSATFAPAMPADTAPAPGGWKTQPSDPHDPDPLGLGALDAPFAYDESVEL
jgi:hypothetical protein